MISIAVPAESDKAERRVALSPETARKFTAAGCEVRIQSGAGAGSFFSDAEYREAGAKVVKGAAATLKGADMVLSVRRPPASALKGVKKGAILVCMLDPYSDRPGLNALAKAGLTLFAMELMPRITRAQSMDVLSSQANLAGYKAVIDAAAQFSRALPLMMTAAGTVPASKVFVMGVGVAGLQAIATAKRLGAVVTATDVRPSTKEQVESLAAKFIAVENEEFRKAETAAGYAKPMSAAYQKKQAKLIAEHIKGQDIVVTTALIPGRPAPELISRAMVESMKPGSVIVDLAAERGGNCAMTKPGAITDHKGVIIMGKTNLAGELAPNASSLYARNLHAFISLMIDPEKKGELAVDWDDELIKGTLVARDGKLVHPVVAPSKGKKGGKK
ncbi:MAG: Re/Si-specific NAD(P)(+) transhydrogenase subunit alpha [Alphaproteobacteria bacterium]|nr:MAG: Re/Si-specific NAD(P)(+) transhydrogenase subunit alpha [Alphaproteobacteria bacterium]